MNEQVSHLRAKYFVNNNKAIILSEIAIPNKSGPNLGPTIELSLLFGMGLFPISIWGWIFVDCGELFP